ncbi:MAG: Holliday junction branch migration protein RuvA [Candidatus Nomurabacteria bacterium]|jgi:Holliday junction DNA helicase RuvA|nr:Holliday junction branch migration protein RuvA [Candidatus Nomurabacteria bacterium]
MIAFIKGKIEEKFAGSLVIDVAGVGYEIIVSDQDYDAAVLGEEAKFYTYHHVREQSEELFGFKSLVAKRLFELLTTVQGIGPKASMAILSLSDAENVRNAIANADSAYVARASGVGKKTAEKVIIDLSDKVGAPKIYGRSGEASKTPENLSGVKDDALEALISLGYTLSDATAALGDISPDLPVEERIKLALRQR